MSSPDWVTKDFYKVLGVTKDADAKAIKKAYRKLARENHPDSHPDDQQRLDRFKEVAEAYDVIGDPKKREEYDEIRSMPQGAFGGGFPGGFGGGGGYTTTGGTAGTGGFPGGFGGGGAEGFDLSDILGGMFGGGGGARRQSRPRPRKGADVEAEATIGFREALDGTTLPMRLTSDAPCSNCQGTGGKPGTRPHICPTCEGAGTVNASVGGGGFMMRETCPTCHGRQLIYDEVCPVCHGSGRGVSDKTIQARIPAGVKDGQKIRLKGKGGAGEDGGPAGDLYVVVHVKADKVFKRKGDNLSVEVPVTFDEAALGAQITVPTPSGSTKTLKIPAGTPSGRTFRVRGQGVKRRDGSTGDLLVSVQVQVPSSLSDAQRQAVDAYRSAGDGADPRADLLAGARAPGGAR